MSEPLARLYDLALRTLDDQQRRADALRSRLGPTLAAAALGVTVLSTPAVDSTAPRSLVGTLALLVAVGGLFVAVFGALAILASRDLQAHELDLRAVARKLDGAQTLDDVEAFYTAMVARLSRAATRNAAVLDGLHARFTAILCGILVMLCGLALAALVG